MANRETAMVWIARNGRDAMLFARAESCLDAAKELADVIGEGAIHVHDDDADFWRWSSEVRSTPTEDK